MTASHAPPGRAFWAALVLISVISGVTSPAARARDGAGRISQLLGTVHCPRCALMLGVGTTFWPQHWTDGIVAPVMLEIDQSRWEIGVYRFATNQYLKYPGFPPSTISAHPYWGFTAMRRWQVLHRKRWKLYLGFGAAYRSETDLLEPIHWNFAYLVALRYALRGGTFLELSVRHWSDAWIRNPNRGQNFLVLTIGFR